MNSLNSTLPTKDHASSSQLNGEENEHKRSEHEFVLSEREAKAASSDMAVCGEEDPGEGLEFLVADESESE